MFPLRSERHITKSIFNPELVITPEQAEMLDSAVEFVRYLTNHWPQTDTVERSGAVEAETLGESKKTETISTTIWLVL